MPKHPKRRTRRNLAVLALSALCLTGFLYWDNTALQVTRFDPVFSDLPAGFDGCRIVVLSDLHGASFGAHNGNGPLDEMTDATENAARQGTAGVR